MTDPDERPHVRGPAQKNWSNQLTTVRTAATLIAMTEGHIRREAVSDQLFALLRDRILGGALPAGSALTAERELAAEFGVNRHAVREAVKRLQQARLVEVSHGGRTQVLDWRRTAGLELAVGIAAADSGPTVQDIARDALEMRACIGADAARLCALRCSARAAAEIAAAVEAHAQAGPDLTELDETYIAWWRLIVEGSGNIAYLLAFNSLVDGLIPVADVPADLGAGEILDVEAHRRLAGHITAREAGAAELLARELLTRSVPAAPRAGKGARR
ncbi:FadR family transcriptional regulator [Streptomyces griseofuscus]|uniref:FadR family transcriptional regulator n=2 Tax=Streptomyces griseofuscus TaxID=146922 RepID=A0A7H1PTE7_9ACTN|nr:FadR family transcriptional regulator [Streptomyces griseofuscus]